METLKFFIVLVLFFLLHTTLIAQNISPQFSELKGVEDAQGNTHLLYRIYSYQEIQPFGFYEDNSLYHYNLTNQTDSLFIRESGSDISAHIYINDYKIINLNPMHYIYAGSACGMECSPFAYNSNSGMIFSDGSWGGSYKIGFGQNPALIYYGLIASGADSTITTLKSNNSGLDWDTLSSSKIFLSINPYENQSSFYSDKLDSRLYKSSNGGINSYVSDTTQNFIYMRLPEFFYDIDQNHIYRNSIHGGPSYVYYLAVSSNKGEPFSWSNKYYSNNPIYFSNDESQSGAIYLADGKKIFISSDYGSTFNFYKELNNRIVGIYKKPSSDKLYAATKYKIYEITPDTIQVIKSLPIPDEILNYYPLAIGNKWVNLVMTVVNPNVYYDVGLTEVLSDSIAPNNKLYYHLKGENNHYLDRVDSLDGRVYRYYDHPDLPEKEYVIADLLGEVGDTIFTFYPNNPNIQTYLIVTDIDTFYKWGLTKIRKNYLQSTEPFYLYKTFSYSQDIGIDASITALPLYSTYSQRTLKGCVINGVVYGDTTLTDIENESELPKEFSLSQNFPNPFNPSTKISWQSPIGSWQTLKVYDILGNEVATLVDEFRNAGSYEVEFKSSVGSLQLASGIYFYQLRAGDFVQTKKMILIK